MEMLAELKQVLYRYGLLRVGREPATVDVDIFTAGFLLGQKTQRSKPTAWIASHKIAGVLHFSIEKGWAVDEVLHEYSTIPQAINGGKMKFIVWADFDGLGGPFVRKLIEATRCEVVDHHLMLCNGTPAAEKVVAAFAPNRWSAVKIEEDEHAG